MYVMAAVLAFLFAGGGQTGSARAETITLTFEEFDVGDTLADVNAVTAPLGVTFDAILPGTFHVGIIGSNKVLTSEMHYTGADILANFSFPVGLVQVEFPQNAPLMNVGSTIFAYKSTQLPGALGNDFNGSSHGPEPIVLSIGPKVPPFDDPIRAVQMEQDGAYIDFVIVDNIVIETFVPEPATLTLLTLGGLALIRRRRSCGGRE